jgi:hypothetical protein
MVVLTIFVFLLARLLDGTRSASVHWNQRMDAESQARLVMDRLALDLAAMPLRPDLDYVFDKKNGDDALSFYAQAKGYQDGLPDSEVPRGVSVLGFRMSANASLERGARALPWDGVIFAPVERAGAVEPVSLIPSPLNTLPPLDSNPAQSNFEVLGDQVLRFELGFLLKPNPAGTPPRAQAKLAASLPPDVRIGDIEALIVAIVTLDHRARALLTPEQIREISDLFKDYSDSDAAGGRDVAWAWNAVLEDPATFQLNGIPLPGVQTVRVYQRYFPLN